MSDPRLINMTDPNPLKSPIPSIRPSHLRVRAQQQRIVARAAGRDQLNDAKPVAESSAQLVAGIAGAEITNIGKRVSVNTVGWVGNTRFI